MTTDDPLDQAPAHSGYTMVDEQGQTFHVWPELCLVICELAGEPVSAGVHGTAMIPLTAGSADALSRIWTDVITRWRRRGCA
jgi:hypothetical protein